MLGLIVCLILGFFLPVFVLGIDLIAETKNDKVIYYTFLVIILFIARMIWGGGGSGINFALILLIILLAAACYKAHDRFMEVLGQIQNIFSSYLSEIKKMSLYVTDNPSALNMKKILKITLIIEAIIWICSITKIYKPQQGLMIIMGCNLYILLMHGVLLKDEALTTAFEKIRGSVRVRLNLIDDGVSELQNNEKEQSETDQEDEMVNNYIQNRSKEKVIPSITEEEVEETPLLKKKDINRPKSISKPSMMTPVMRSRLNRPSTSIPLDNEEVSDEIEQEDLENVRKKFRNSMVQRKMPDVTRPTGTNMPEETYQPEGGSVIKRRGRRFPTNDSE